MSKIVSFPAPNFVVGDITLPESSPARWRRELHACEGFYDAAALVYRIIREIERQEKVAQRAAEIEELHQLAFPWARAE